MLRFNNISQIKITTGYNFNTSYVTVQLCTKLRNIPTISNFNTSYVTVQLAQNSVTFPPSRFQYILCYGSTSVLPAQLIIFIKFQYILCYGSTTFCISSFLIKISFQYILCYGSTHWCYVIYIFHHT